MSGSLIRETPPWARMSAGTRSSAITATAPASSAILACSGVTTSMMTPPFSISAMPRLTPAVPVTRSEEAVVSGVLPSVTSALLRGSGFRARFRDPDEWTASSLPPGSAGLLGLRLVQHRLVDLDDAWRDHRPVVRRSRVASLLRQLLAPRGVLEQP